MGRFDEFELTLQKINDFPLTYEAVIPRECNFFQDVRRYQCVSTHLDIRVIKVDGRITVDPDMEPVSINRLTAAEKKEWVDYLTIRVARGDNIGYAWAFFRPTDGKGPTVAFGANIVHSDAAVGQERVRRLLAYLQKAKGARRFQKKWLAVLVTVACIGLVVFAGYRYGHLAKRFPFKPIERYTDTPGMKFYQEKFPTVFDWLKNGKSLNHRIAEELLRTEYVSDLLLAMAADFHGDREKDASPKGHRLVLFVYFNYNTHVSEGLNRYAAQLQDTEFMRLARMYSCQLSGYASNIFYYKVGELSIKHTEINRFMKQNMISYRDIKKIRDVNAFSELMERDSINFKMKSFLQDVYTFTPLRIEEPLEGKNWYLLTQKDAKTQDLLFAAFFNADNATLVPKRIGNRLLDTRPGEDIDWYALDDVQAKELKLTPDALVYFTKTTGQALKLDVIKNKIRALNLTPVNGYVPVTVHRELLMGDSKGKYGIQTYDPITSLVLSNLITKRSFEQDSNLVLKRDPIQVNTTLVQLSKDDSFSVQSVTITPGTTGIVRLFEPDDSFRARFADGSTAVFEKADVNLFNPFTFMINNDSITFSFRHDITDMEIDLRDKKLKIIKAGDGNHQIIETH